MSHLDPSLGLSRVSQRKPAFIVAFGDSWTYGNCAQGWLAANRDGACPESIEGSWTSQLRRGILKVDPCANFVDVGRPGWKIEQGLEGYGVTVAPHRPTMLILNFGISDRMNKVSLKSFEKNVDGIIRKAIAQQSACFIWTSGLVAVCVGESYGHQNPVKNADFEISLEAYNEILRGFADRYLLLLADAAREIEDGVYKN